MTEMRLYEREKTLQSHPRSGQYFGRSPVWVNSSPVGRLPSEEEGSRTSKLSPNTVALV